MPGLANAMASDVALDPRLAERSARRILVVDDNPVNQLVAVRMLEYCGYAPDMAADGLEAVAAVERQPYDLVLMDIQMPEMDGIEATREIRRRLPPSRQPHIAGLSAAASIEDRDDCLRAGMDDLMIKPFRPEHLMRAIERSRR